MLARIYFRLSGCGTTVKGSSRIFQRFDLTPPHPDFNPPFLPLQHPKHTSSHPPGTCCRDMVSGLWSRATMPSRQDPPLPPFLSFGVRILLLSLCGHAFSIPVERRPGSDQYPLQVGATHDRDGLDAKVLILGAGVAGITAAQKLESYGISDFLIVEAHHEVGGRLKSRPFGSPVDRVRTSPSTTPQANDTLKSIEVGAQWIQGYHEDNPIWGLAKKHGVRTQLSDFAGSVSELPSFLPAT